MKLYTYFRSSAAYRVRIALNLKGIDAELVPVHLLKDGGEQFGPAYDALNPQHLVPLLEHDGMALGQSLAIIEYLDETHPQQPLLPPDARGRARVRALSQAIACDIHPIDNLRVLKYLSDKLDVSLDQKGAWYRHWVALGLEALERQVSRDRETGSFCHGDTPTMADCCLVPQLYNARRFDCDLAPYPTLTAIASRCEALPAFDAASPDKQPDAR
ncbi:maleylacetoacetate isomerase [Pseudoduganella umbonata]|uniref:Maleylacetoacetate isomerase n=1 Tax=Pseudoduganella umbonata TaxID=864828 RepID=A0A4P8HQB9_9BURK|nr:maleylacetoacetate isomerase [Pseudoduganella umbonata]MBB3220522.1 maleylacetoacetate isomerase/maleylpyruvate isomerase [Pseudoduganella umbonata]QCP11963.1 maleylacetoacetate isomerase [Pseudoduganella umbonata]